MLHNFEDLRKCVGSAEPKTVAVACAHDGHTLEAVLRAAQEGILRYILIGHADEILSAGRTLGCEIDPARVYILVTDDYLQRGSGYPSLAAPDELCRYDKWFIRDMVEHFLTHRELFESARIRRLL